MFYKNRACCITLKKGSPKAALKPKLTMKTTMKGTLKA